MTSLRIQHRTTYRYRTAVAFGPHRLMLRPRESRDLQLTGFEVVVTPTPQVTWAQDVWGNAVATATFQSMHDTMVVDSVAQIELGAAAWPIFDIAASAIVYRSVIRRTSGWTSARCPSGSTPIRRGISTAGRGQSCADPPQTRSPCSRTSPRRFPQGSSTKTVRKRGRRHRSRRSRAGLRGACRGGGAQPGVRGAHRLGVSQRCRSAGVRSLGAGATHGWAEVYVPVRAGEPSIRRIAAFAART
jgi:transglutaminase-like putative cysteine protease